MRRTESGEEEREEGERKEEEEGEGEKIEEGRGRVGGRGGRDKEGEVGYH